MKWTRMLLSSGVTLKRIITDILILIQPTRCRTDRHMRHSHKVAPQTCARPCLYSVWIWWYLYSDKKQILGFTFGKPHSYTESVRCYQNRWRFTACSHTQSTVRAIVSCVWQNRFFSTFHTTLGLRQDRLSPNLTSLWNVFSCSRQAKMFFCSSLPFFSLKQSQKPKQNVSEMCDPKTEAVKSTIKMAGYYLVVKQYGLFSGLCQYIGIVYI